eukprot:TRINITY_DN2946_c0_g1_i2.p3 TRINITY_DN2946_c0_g1~~TRINITY_DN2946_c0_g1_i2.p3  ORF type:complete len:156 (-),score=24.76 TRINITY_DN2946_c0_g1_i2:143-610(-)
MSDDEEQQYKPKGVKELQAEDFIVAYAQHLKSTDKLQLPDWVDLVKTASHKELAPYNVDWYYVRAASICRKLYIKNNLGVGILRRIYGGSKKNSGTRSEHFHKAAGGLIRHILKQLEDAGLVETKEDGKGRILTDEGRRDMDLIAGRVPTNYKYL